MKKKLFIAEKPSVAREFAKVMKIKTSNKTGYIESDRVVITWCVGHLVNMSYPEKYDEKLKKWKEEDLPFMPDEYKYEVIDNVRQQYDIVSTLLNREDIDTIYVCTDSGREGEYIYRLVEMMANVKNKERKRVWIDSQTEEEILRGIKEAKNLDEYDNLSDAAYLRAIEDYLIGINYSRIYTLNYGNMLGNILSGKNNVIAVGRVMTCVLGMIVIREREIKNFIKDKFYKINVLSDVLEGKYKVDDKSIYFQSNKLFDDTGFKKEEDANALIKYLSEDETIVGKVEEIKKGTEKKNPPLLYNLAELQNDCSKKLKISPKDTLKIVQELYEKKMLTYPRTDARVLTKAVSKEIIKNLRGLKNSKYSNIVNIILEKESYKGLDKTKYVNDKKVTDHYAIIPTGVGAGNIEKLNSQQKIVYDMVVRKFLSIFCDNAEYKKISIKVRIKTELFLINSKVCVKRGYLDIVEGIKEIKAEDNNLAQLKKDQEIVFKEFVVKEGETSPPKRYNSGTIILAMENAGKLIEDEQLREQIKSTGIGTSATRAEILSKLERINYININSKTQILTPSSKGEIIYDIIKDSIPTLLEPEFTASWEKGLSMVEKGELDREIYLEKLKNHVLKNIIKLKNNKKYKNIFNNIIKYNQADKKGKCKCCGGEILENTKAFYCVNYKYGCKFTIWKDSLKDYGIVLDNDMIRTLLSEDECEVEIGNSKYLVRFKDKKKGILYVDLN